MNGTVKLKLRDGLREIELEGSRQDVDGLLEKWWQKTSEVPKRADAGESSSVRVERGATNRHKRSPRAPEQSKEGSIDANDVANEIKNSADFAIIEKKILHADNRAYEKLALPIWFTDQALTSGAIHRILQALQIRIALPTVSNTLKRNIQKFTTSRRRGHGGPPPAYRLTSKARADFEAWLRSKDAT